QLRRDALVGVDDEDPVVRGAVDAVVFLRRRAEVFTLLDAYAGERLANELDGAVLRKRIEQVDLVGPLHGADARLDVLDLVERVDQDGDRDARHGAKSYTLRMRIRVLALLAVTLAAC